MKKVKVSFNNIFLYITFICSVFSTMPIVSVRIGGRSVSLFTFTFMLEMFFLFFYFITGESHCINKDLKLLLIWLFLAGISSVMGGLYSIIYPEMTGKSMAYLPKIVMWFLFVLMWESQPKKVEGIRFLAKGILIGCLLNLVWAIIDAGVYYTTGISLGNMVFSNYIIKGSKYTGRVSLIYGTGLYRAGGFNHDPAHIGFVAPIVAAYAIKSRKYQYLVFAFGGIMASASTTGLLCTLIIIGFCLLDDMLIKRWEFGRIKRKTFLYSMLFLLCCLSVAYIFRTQLVKIAGRAFSLFFARISSTYLSSNINTPRHFYIRYFLQALLCVGPMLITGMGFGTASFGYGHNPVASAVMNFSIYDIFDIENTYIAYLMDNGIIGFGLFIYYSLVIFGYFHKKCKYTRISDTTTAMSYAGIITTALAFLFYHYILFAPQVLLIVLALSQMDYEKTAVKNKRIKGPLKGVTGESVRQTIV